MTPPTGQTTHRASRSRRRWWILALPFSVLILELGARTLLARPLGIIRHSTNAEIVYENVPGTYIGRPTYNVRKAPMFMIWDLMRTDTTPLPTQIPPGAALYRIDPDGCRASSTGPFAERAEIVVAGSSQVFGMLLSNENSVPGLLEQALRDGGRTNLRVANCSVVGHRFLQTLSSVRRSERAKHPQLVVVLVRPWHMTEPFPYADVMAPRNPLRYWLIQRSGLARAAHFFSWHDSPHPPPLTRARIASGLDTYAADLRASGVRSLFILLDDHSQDCATFDELTPLLRARGLAVERIETPSTPEMFLDPDRHWSIHGGAYTTAQILGFVQRELAAPRAGGVNPPAPPAAPVVHP